MKAIVNAKALTKELKKASVVIKKTTVMPILSFVLFRFGKNTLTIEATDLETTMKQNVDCDCKTPFELLFDFNDITRICDMERDQPLSIDASGEQIIIKSDNSTYKLSKVNETDTFPKTPDVDYKFSVDVDEDFFSALVCASACKGSDEADLRMYGVSIKFFKDRTVISGTNALMAYRHVLKTANDDEAEILICEKFISITKNLSSGKLSIGEKNIKLESNEMTVISRLYDAKFVPLDMLIPQSIDYNMSVERSVFMGAINRVSVAGSLSEIFTRIIFEDGGVRLISENFAYGKEAESSLKAQHSRPIEQIAINCGQMNTVLGLFNSESVEMCFTSDRDNIFIRPEGEPNVVALVRPIAYIKK